MDSQQHNIRHGVLGVRRHTAGTAPGGLARRLASSHPHAWHSPLSLGQDRLLFRSGLLPASGHTAAARPVSGPIHENDAHIHTYRSLPLHHPLPVQPSPRALRLLQTKHPGVSFSSADGDFLRSDILPDVPATAVPAHETSVPSRKEHGPLGQSMRAFVASVFRRTEPLSPVGHSTVPAEHPEDSIETQSGLPGEHPRTMQEPARTTVPVHALPATGPGALSSKPREILADTAEYTAVNAGGRRSQTTELLRSAGRKTARPLPAWAAPLARLTGNRTTPAISEGPETRRALETTGAEAAALDSTIFVSGPVNEPAPRAAEVLGHELVHTAHRPATPRFFMRGIFDDEEKAAHVTGKRARAAFEPMRKLVTGRSPGKSAERARMQPDVPTTGAPGNRIAKHIPEFAPATPGNRAAPFSASPFPATKIPGPFLRRTEESHWHPAEADLGFGETTGETSALTHTAPGQQIAEARDYATGRAARELSATQKSIGGRAETAPIRAPRKRADIDSLPVSGAGIIVTRNRERLPDREAHADNAIQSPSGTAESRPDKITGPAHHTTQTAPAAEEETRTSATEETETHTGTPGTATQQTTGGIGSLLGGGASAAYDATSQMGELMELIEERIVAEIERRGGRFEGVF